MSIRTERLESLIQKDLGPIFQEYQNDTIITITNVRITPDLSIAKIYLSIFAPGRDIKAIYEYLNEHNTSIRTKLAHLIRHQVRKIPELHFYLDDTSEYVNRLEQLFDKIHKKDDDKDQMQNDE